MSNRPDAEYILGEVKRAKGEVKILRGVYETLKSEYKSKEIDTNHYYGELLNLRDHYTNLKEDFLNASAYLESLYNDRSQDTVKAMREEMIHEIMSKDNVTHHKAEQDVLVKKEYRQLLEEQSTYRGARLAMMKTYEVITDRTNNIVTRIKKIEGALKRSTND